MPRIIVYTQSGCVASQVWVEMLRARGIEFVERRIGTDPAAISDLSEDGPVATPTTVVEGRRYPGLSRATLAALTDGDS